MGVHEFAVQLHLHEECQKVNHLLFVDAATAVSVNNLEDLVNLIRGQAFGERFLGQVAINFF